MLADGKVTLRKRVLSERAALSDSEKYEISHSIFERLLQDNEFLSCKVIFLYCSTENEISTDEIAEYCFSHGKSVCVPRCLKKGVMMAHRISSFYELTLSKSGIREPKPTCPVISPLQIDMVLAPCLCADRQGYRLGYGGGYYDRFLQDTHAIVVGLCAAARLLSAIPAELHDQRCHKIVTEREVLVTYEK